MSESGVRVYLLPGLAADQRLLEPIARLVPEVRLPAWLPPIGRETLDAYAARMALAIARQHTQEGGGTMFVGGFSFGGQVAQEMVRHLSPTPAGVILICGVRGREQFTRTFGLQQKLGAIVPGFVQRRLYGPMARRFAARCGLDAEMTTRLVEMARANDPAFLRWSGRACASWAARPDLRGVRVWHIHGGNDDVIPDPRARADVTLPGGHHLITWTHPQEVAAFVRLACGLNARD